MAARYRPDLAARLQAEGYILWQIQPLPASDVRRFLRAVLEPLLKYRHDYPTYHLLAEAAYNLDLRPGYEYDTDTIRFTYESPSTPEQTFDYDIRTRERTLRKTQEIPSGHDPERYAVERIFSTGVKTIVTSDTLPPPPVTDRMKVVSVAPLLAELALDSPRQKVLRREPEAVVLELRRAAWPAPGAPPGDPVADAADRATLRRVAAVLGRYPDRPCSPPRTPPFSSRASPRPRTSISGSAMTGRAGSPSSRRSARGRSAGSRPRKPGCGPLSSPPRIKARI